MPARRLTLVTVDEGWRFELVAANCHRGALRIPRGVDPPAVGARLVLESREPRLATVRFYVEVTSAGPEEGDPELITVAWVLLSATGRRRYLVTALSEVLGLKARLTGDTDELGPHRKLIYQAAKRQVRLINVGEALEPPSGVAATPRRDGETRPAWRRTQPSILVATRDESD